MKLLFDENLSHRLVSRLAKEYPDSAHVRDVALRAEADGRIWDYAQKHGFAIVSKDTDFSERSFVEGAPPKVILLDVGNSGTGAIAALLGRSRATIDAFEAQPETSLLVLSLGPRLV